MKNGRNAALNGGRGSGQTVRYITELYENKIADIKANCDLAIEGRDIKIMELMEEKAEMLDLLKEVEVLMKMWLSDEPFTITQHKGLIADTEQLVEKIGEKVK